MKASLLAAVAGLLAVSALLFLYPRHDPLEDQAYLLDRSKAIEAARAEAQSHGLDIADWEESVSTREHDRTLDRAPARSALGRSEHYAPLVRTIVRFSSPDEERSLLVELDGLGRLVEFRLRLPVPEREDPEVPPPPPEIPETTPEEVLEALRRMTGEDARLFQPASAPTRGAMGDREDSSGINITSGPSGVSVQNRTVQYRFVADSLSSEGAKVEARVDWRDERVMSGRVGVQYLIPGDDDTWIVVTIVISMILLVGSCFVGIAFYIVGWVNGEIRHRKMLAGLCWVIAVSGFFYFAGAGAESKRVEDPQSWVVYLEYGLTTVFLIVPVIIALWGAGFMFTVRAAPRRLAEMDLALRGRFWWRPVGRAAAIGLGAGAVMAVIPYLFAELGLAGQAFLELPYARAWTVRPALASLTPFQNQGLTILTVLFGFAYPMAECYLRRVWIVRSGVMILACLALADFYYTDASPLALLATVPAAILLEQVYRRFGLLPMLISVWVVGPLHQAVALGAFSSPALRGSGLTLFILLGVGWVAALAVGAFGRAFNVQDLAAHWQQEYEWAVRRREAEREKLLSEFSVARRAQEMMLPESAPEISGFEVSASCQPANEVGGDLYDFCRLNGHLGVVVADVSGKGVPAALYMTLTKGLLHSVTRHVEAPGEIVLELNRHLHGCAGRHVFVTLVMASIQPGDGSVECVRAGHNPILWFRAEDAQGTYLNSSGIGLGLAGDRLFQRSLAVEKVNLAPNDLLVLYSDGITEAMDAHGNEYGEDRLNSVLKIQIGESAHVVREAILRDVREFVGDTPQHDDMTLIVVRRTPEVGPAEEARDHGEARLA